MMGQTWRGERGGRSRSAGTYGQERKFGLCPMIASLVLRELAGSEILGLVGCHTWVRDARALTLPLPSVCCGVGVAPVVRAGAWNISSKGQGGPPVNAHPHIRAEPLAAGIKLGTSFLACVTLTLNSLFPQMATLNAPSM